jgi:UDP-glucose 4-epimerase
VGDYDRRQRVKPGIGWARSTGCAAASTLWRKMATYLVTGGCGFIGSHLSRALSSRGDAVRVLDDLSTGSAASLSPKVDVIEGDVADPVAVHRAFSGVDGCFHLAAIASVERCNREWLRAHRTNLTGALTVFNAAVSEKTPVVYTSSAAVYGDRASLPLSETSRTQPLSAYGADKLGCELHASAARRVHGLRSVGLRLFNVYGPGQDPKSPYSGVISLFCDRVWRGVPIDIFGDGNQTRDFVFVADVVVALLRAMEHPMSDAPVFNICTGHRTSVLQLARAIAALGGGGLEIRFRPERAGDVRHSCGDPSAARRALGLGEPTQLATGLAAIADRLRLRRRPPDRSDKFTP